MPDAPLSDCTHFTFNEGVMNEQDRERMLQVLRDAYVAAQLRQLAAIQGIKK